MKPRFRPVIRVFVSSTFSDLKEERNVLQRDVFPRLEQYCLTRGFQFQAIDLRWGVPGEAGLDHRTMQICFDELRRAQEVSPRPNFLVLLGDRYGWQPLAEEVTGAEFLELEKAAAQLDANAAQGSRADESATQLLRTWYRRDDNADPAAYVLRSRHEPPDSGDYTDTSEGARWMNAEKVLWAVINRAYPPEGLAGRFSHIPGQDEPLPTIVKVQSSATEQEIWRGALAVPDAPDHVVAWFRTIRNRGEYLSDQRANVFFDRDATLHRAASELRDQLNRTLRKEGERGVTPVEVDLRPSEDGKRLEVTLDHLATMCHDIEMRMLQTIEKEISEYWHPSVSGRAVPQAPVEATGPSEARRLELEQLAHEQFGESRAPEGRFVGREKELEAIGKYLSDENDHKPLVVYGSSGTGKTALMARAAQSAAGAGRRILVRFLGTTPQSSNLRSLLTNLCRALRSAEEVEQAVRAELRELQDEFDQHLASATEDEPIFLFLDALDQLDEADGARQIYWLRTPLPPHVKVVVSCIYDADGEKELNESYLALDRRKLLEGLDGQHRAIAVESLPADEAMEFLDRWLEHANPKRGPKRRLTDQQRKAIKTHIAPDAATACRRPLYMRLLFEQCRLWPSWKRVKPPELGANANELLQQLLDRLALPAVHGLELVESALGYIASGRRGLSENEILEVLWADPEYKEYLDGQSRQTGHEFPPLATRIPIAIWSRLRHDLDPYLAEHAAPGGAVINFYHREVGRVVAKRFLSHPERRVLRHGRLAKYFQGDRQPWWRELDVSGQAPEIAAHNQLPNARRASELPWQLLRVAEASDPHSERPAVWDAPVDALCDMEFVSAKCAARLVFELQEDYRDATRRLPESQAALREGQRHAAEIARWTDGIIRYSQAWSERRERVARGEPVVEDEPALPVLPVTYRMWADEEIESESRRIIENPSRQDRVQAFAGFIGQECYPLLEFGSRPGFAIQHAFNHAPRGVVHHAVAHVLPSVQVPLLTRHWGTGDRYFPKPACLRVLEGHTDWVVCLSAAPDGRRAVSGSRDKTLRVWDLESGACLQVLEGHTDWVVSVSVMPDSRRAVSGSRDGTLRVWDLETGVCLRVLEGHAGEVRSVKSGLRVVGWLNLVREAHAGEVISISVTPDSRHAVLGSRGLDKTLSVWDLEAGVCMRVLEGHTGEVKSVSVTPDGRRALSGTDDKMLRVWDLETGACLRVLEGHTHWVESVSVTPDSRRAVSASSDKTLRVWDLELGVCLRVLEGHTDWVVSVSVTPDGRRAVSGSNDKTLRVWDLELSVCMRVLEGHTGPVESVSVTPDGRRAVSGSRDKTVRLWDLETGVCPRVREGTTELVSNVSVTPDSRRAVSGSRDKTVRVWDLETGTCLRILEGHTHWVESVSVTPDSRRAVSGSYGGMAGDDNTLRVWDLETGACLRTLELSVVRSLSVMPDNRRAVSGSCDSTLRLWDLETGACLRVLEGHTHWVESVSVTPDSRRAVSASKDKTVRVWDLELGVCLRVLQGHTGEVRSVSVTPDGRRAVSGSSDKTLRVWDLETGVCLRVLEGHTDWVVSVSVTPDGRRALSGSNDKTLRVWDLEAWTCAAILRLSTPSTTVALAPALGRVIVGTAGDMLQFDLRGIVWTLARPLTTNRTEDPEAQLRRELIACLQHWGESHTNTLLCKLGLAALLDQDGRRTEAIAIYRDVGNTCLSLSVEAVAGSYLTPGEELIERLLPCIVNAKEDVLLLALRNKLKVAREKAKARNKHESLQIDRRVEAQERYQRGDLPGAEELLRVLLQEGFEVPGTHCHLARVLLLTDREAEARQEINQAWASRDETPQDETPRYVLARILFFQCLFAFLDGADGAAMIRQLKAAVCARDTHEAWIIEPVLEHLEARLVPDKLSFLRTLAAALSGSGIAMDKLENFECWRDAQPKPLG